VVWRDAGALAGSLRVVLPAPQRRLPTEREFGLRARPPGRVPEAGRVIVGRSWRERGTHLILAGLCARAWLEMCALGYDRAVSTAAPDVIELHRSLGMRITVLGPPKLHWGTERAPIQIMGDEGSFSFLTASPGHRLHPT
jgi:hypothetical protein